jgi:hypothetical protein
MDAFNSPIEVGSRLLTLLVAAYPHPLDVNQLVLLDHALIHSSDLGGPPSLHPPVQLRVSELGMKRTNIESALTLLLRTELAVLTSSDRGLEYQAGEGAGHFISLLESEYAHKLVHRAHWVISRFGDLDSDILRQETRRIFDAWAEEFDNTTSATGENG